MLFSFLQYVSPIWYFNLTPKSNRAIFDIDLDQLAVAEQQLLTVDHDYETVAGRQHDLVYQALQKGFIEKTTHTESLNISPSIYDNYRFLRKYFHPAWSYYVLFKRLLSLCNPISEINTFLKCRRVKKADLFTQVFPHKSGYQLFSSTLLNQKPLVTIIIPTLNRYPYLDHVLQDLTAQDYQNFEVIIVDQSEPVQDEFYNKYALHIRLLKQEEKALWKARNEAIKEASSEWILLTEDDVRLPANWISNHLKSLDYFQADISTGVFFPEGSTIPKSRSFFRLAEQLSTGNACIKKEVFRKIGLFDRQFERQRMGDGEFGLRAYLAGFKSISNPYAYCVDIKAPVGGLRQMGSWDAFRPKKWWAPRPVPSVLYLVRKYYGNQLAFNLLLISVPPSLIPYRFKRKPFLLLLGSLLIVPLAPLVLWQIFSSWQKATQMLKETSKIEFLKDKAH
jgi:glycosyltransferase involved in cell wall biosynthesis